MDPKFSSSQHFRERFLQEATAMAKLRHDRIVPLNDFFEDDITGLLILVMPFMEGTTLEHLIERAPAGLPLQTVLDYGKDILSALAYAHDKAIVHRDVKPSNILITPENKAYLMDFGIAKILSEGGSSQTQVGSFLGTALYASPEQIRGEAMPDGRTDIYSVACVIYESLTGRPPFDPPGSGGEKMVAIQAAHLRDAPPKLCASRPDLPPKLEKAVLKALSKRREDRFANCGQFADMLARVGYGGTVEDGRTTTVEHEADFASRPAEVSRGGPVRKLVVAGGVAAILAAGVLLFFNIGSQPPAKANAEIRIQSEPRSSSASGSSTSAAIRAGAVSSTASDARKTTKATSEPPIVGSTAPRPGPEPGQAEYDEAVAQKSRENYCASLRSAESAIVAAHDGGKDTTRYEAFRAGVAKSCTNFGDKDPPRP
jgi:serine/threonine-protein kinase